MRYSDEEYEAGEVWIDKETGERFVCVALTLCEDTYYDVVYIVSEEEFLENIGSNMRESDLESFDTIEDYNIGDYDWVRGRKYKVESETVYKFEKLI